MSSVVHLYRDSTTHKLFYLLPGIFASLPFHHCVRVVDCYLLEGEKFLYRIALELALQFEKHRKKPATLEEMREFCENIAEYVTPSQLISNASKLSRLSRKGLTFSNDFHSRLDVLTLHLDTRRHPATPQQG